MTARRRAVLGYVALFVAIGAQAPYLVLYLESRGFDLARTGAIVSLTALVGLVAAPAWGAVSDRRRGAPVVLAVATVVGAVGAVGVWVGGEPVIVVVAAAAMSAGLAGVGPILDARGLEIAGAERAGYGPLRAWGSISYICGAFATGMAIDRWGEGAMFPILAGALLVTGAVGLTLRPSTAYGAAARRPLRDAGRLFGPRGLGLFLLGAALAWTSLAAVSGFYAIRLAELGAPATAVGAAAALGAAVEVPIMLRFPALVERFGAQRLLVIGAAIFGIRSFAAAAIDEPLVLVALSAANGVGFALFLIGGVAWVSRHAPPELAATAQGIFQGVTISLAHVVAAGVGGAIAAVGGIPAMYAVSGVVGCLGAGVIAAAVRRPTPARASEIAVPAR